MKIRKTAQSRLKEVDFEHLGFGEIFSDHMLSVEYKGGKWGEAEILPYGPIEMYPAICSLHYGQIIFEGLKAFCGKNGSIYLFRPQKYHERMNQSCKRLCIPEVSLDVFLKGLKELITLDKEWVPKKQRVLPLYPSLHLCNGKLSGSQGLRYLSVSHHHGSCGGLL